MHEKAINTLKNLENTLYFISTEIPHQSAMPNNQILELLQNVSCEITKTIRILNEKKVESNILLN